MTVTLHANELTPMRSAMRDVQISIHDYYRNTAGFVNEDQFTTPIRATIAFIQKVHEVMQKKAANRSDYKQEFDLRLANNERGAQTIEAIR